MQLVHFWTHVILAFRQSVNLRLSQMVQLIKAEWSRKGMKPEVCWDLSHTAQEATHRKYVFLQDQEAEVHDGCEDVEQMEVKVQMSDPIKSGVAQSNTIPSCTCLPWVVNQLLS